jgi:phytoene synthase
VLKRMTTREIDPALTSAYETCRRMHRRHDPTYYWATRRLPVDIRPATHALYGYVRTADQIVDGPRRDARPEARRAALDAWEAELEAGLAAGRSAQPVVGALVDAGRRHRLPLGELRAYMRSMRLDCAPVRIESWEELVTYMDGSAGSVGRIMAPLLGVPERHHAGFGRLGLAFQHANFIRDVREDRRLDRIYLPGEDRRRFGVAESDFARPASTPELRALVAHEVRRARGLFASAEAAVEAAPASVRPGIRLACTIYLGVLDRVEALGYDVLRRRPRLPAWQLPLVALAALRR